MTAPAEAALESEPSGGHPGLPVVGRWADRWCKRPEALATLGLLVLALALNLALPRPDPDRALAASLVGPVERIALPGPPAYRAGRAAVLFFEARGMEGPIRGAVVVANERIREVVFVREREGLDRRALGQEVFRNGFRGRTAAPPLVVQTVTGATVSSQLVMDAVNERLKVWREAER